MDKIQPRNDPLKMSRHKGKLFTLVLAPGTGVSEQGISMKPMAMYLQTASVWCICMHFVSIDLFICCTNEHDEHKIGLVLFFM